MSDRTPPPDDELDLARKVLETEAQAIRGLVGQLDAGFHRAVDLLQGCTGRVVLTGMGKSGIIAHKICGHALEHGHARDLSACRRSRPRRPRRRPEQRRRRCPVLQRRDGGAGPAARVDSAHRRAAHRHHRPSQVDARAGVRRRAQLPRRRRSVPDEPGAHGEHDGCARARRRPRPGPLAPEGLRFRLSSRTSTRAAASASGSCGWSR